ncbi:MAG: response regulator [Cyanobacteriota bacterium]|nr:response regulator [Cyanobacteriota bacterium]
MKTSAIICVDDEPFVLESLKEQLKRYFGNRYYIEVAQSGEEALEIVEDLQEEGIDVPLIISDQIMPGMKGDELLIQLHDRYPKMLKIMLTGQASAEAVGRVVNAANLYRYIAKPWDETDLSLTVTEALGRYACNRQLAEQNEALKKLNASLEQKVVQRTVELTTANVKLQQEICDRQLLEEKLRTSEEKLRAVFEAMTDIVLVIDEQGKIEIAPTNPRRLYDSETDPILQTIEQFFLEEKSEIWFSKIQQALTTQQTVNFDYSLPLNNREAWFTASISPMPNNCVIWVARNIDKRKQAEAAMQEAKEAAEAANRAKSTFLANMSHELRSPLNVILGFCQLLTRSQSLNPEQQENITIMTRSGEHLLTLINNVLDLSKIEAGRTTLHEINFDLYGLLDDLDDMFQAKAEDKNLQLVFDRTGDVPQYIRTDQVKLRQVLINLINNALKFTQTGRVSVRVRGEPESRRKTNHTPHSTITFEVEDTGAGIASDELENIFEAFVQTQIGIESQEGTGLGLSIARKFVQLMGGEISITSVVGQGTIFNFDIKITKVNATDIEDKQPTRRVVALEPNQPRYRILIVDDKWNNRQLLLRLLNPLGFELKEASNGKEAIEVWETFEPHLIWMDMRMPVLDGYEATKQIKTQLKGQATAIIALTASTLEEQRAVILSAGCDDFVRKPFREQVIFDKIAQYLGVRYIYEELSPPHAAVVKHNSSLQASLANMPSEWVNELYEAANLIDNEQILQLLEQIPTVDAFFRQTISDWIYNFRCDKIIDLIETNKAGG